MYHATTKTALKNSLTDARFPITRESSHTLTMKCAFRILTIGLWITDRGGRAAFVNICKEIKQSVVELRLMTFTACNSKRKQVEVTRELFNIGDVIFQHMGALCYIATHFVKGCSNLLEQHHSKLSMPK